MCNCVNVLLCVTGTGSTTLYPYTLSCPSPCPCQLLRCSQPSTLEDDEIPTRNNNHHRTGDQRPPHHRIPRRDHYTFRCFRFSPEICGTVWVVWGMSRFMSHWAFHRGPFCHGYCCRRCWPDHQYLDGHPHHPRQKD